MLGRVMSVLLLYPPPNRLLRRLHPWRPRLRGATTGGHSTIGWEPGGPGAWCSTVMVFPLYWNVATAFKPGAADSLELPAALVHDQPDAVERSLRHPSQRAVCLAFWNAVKTPIVVSGRGSFFSVVLAFPSRPRTRRSFHFYGLTCVHASLIPRVRWVPVRSRR